MAKVFIVSGCRTPVGNFNGQFETMLAFELGACVLKGTLQRASLNPSDIDQVILGQVLTAGQGQNPARQAAMKAGIPSDAPAFTVNMLCGSGLKSVALAYQAILANDSGIVLAGGQESMTRAEHSAFLRNAKYGDMTLKDTVLSDGLTDAFNQVHMGLTAENLADKYNVSREEQDAFAQLSQTKAEEALKKGHFDEEILAVTLERARNKPSPVKKDEFPRANCTVESLARLRPAFKKENGTVTAGNASGINDGAAAVLLASEKEVVARNLKPLAEIIAFTEVGVDPMLMGLGPVGAVKKLLEKTGWNKNDVDLFELNEAFAVQSILVVRELGIDVNKVNVSGGAIALGHPIGASGARCLVTLIYNMRRMNKKKGIVSLCIGGGMGIAMAVELCQ